MHHCSVNCNHNYCDDFCKKRHEKKTEDQSIENLPCHKDKSAKNCEGGGIKNCSEEHYSYIAVDPLTCKHCKAVFCKNCTLGACFNK